MFINVEQLQRYRENPGTEEERTIDRWIPVSLNLSSIETYYPENENFTNEVYFILQGMKNTKYRWKFSVEELLEISPIVKNSYYSLVRNLKFIEIIENKFYKYDSENEKITLMMKTLFKYKMRDIQISQVKMQLLDKPKREIKAFQKNIKSNLPQIWVSYVEYQRNVANQNLLFLNQVEETKLKAYLDAWKSFDMVEKELKDYKLKRVARKQFKTYYKNQVRNKV